MLPFHVLALRHGESVYVMPRFKAKDYAHFIDHYQITKIPLVPPMALTLFDSAMTEDYSFSSLREITCGGAPLGGGIQINLAKKLHPDARFHQLWGMSELGWLTAFNYPEYDDTGSVGRLLPNTVAK